MPAGHPLTDKAGIDNCGKPANPEIQVNAMALDLKESRVLLSAFFFGAIQGAVGKTNPVQGA